MKSGVELAVEFRHDTGRAIKVYDYAADNEFWIPWSVISERHGNLVAGQEITVVVEEWFARKEGLIK